MIYSRLMKFAACLALLIPLTSHTVHADAMPAEAEATPKNQLDVFKSPTCGCCEAWIAHAQAHGLQLVSHNLDDLHALKSRYGIRPRYQSCHTAVSAENYVFEGHVPAPLIARFLAEKPQNAIGLAVAGMPVGSPGMEMGDRFTPYDVLILKRDGSSEVYARVAILTQAF